MLDVERHQHDKVVRHSAAFRAVNKIGIATRRPPGGQRGIDLRRRAPFYPTAPL